MNLSDKIAEKTTSLIAKKDALVAAQKAFAEDSEADGAYDNLDSAIKAVEDEEKQLQVLKRAEEALRTTADKAPAVIKSHKTKEGSADLLFKAALVSFESHVTHQPVDAVIAKRFGDDDGVRAVVSVVNKAAQNPAFTNVAGYAQELTQQSYGAFMDLLLPASAVANLAMNRYSFDGYNSIYIPMRGGARNSGVNMAGAFRAEGAPIRVGGMTFTSKTLTPKTLGIIGTFSEEMLRRSTPNILQVIRNAMIDDTSVALDNAFLGTAAGTAIQPAGIANALGSYTFVSGGATAEQIYADLIEMVKLQSDALLGSNPAWIMTPGNAIFIGGSLTALGTVQFPGMQAARGQKTLFGYPVIETTNIAASRLLLVDQPYIEFAGGAPEFLGTQVATLHEEGSNPAPLVTGPSGTEVVATPQRSLYQTYSQALRTVWEVDWTVARTGAVVELTGIAW